VVPLAIVRQYAVGQQIAYEVADQEIVLHYALRLLNEAGLVGRPESGSAPGPLLFIVAKHLLRGRGEAQ